MAYTQALMGTTVKSNKPGHADEGLECKVNVTTLVRLPHDCGPDWWKSKGFKGPVAPMERALYGHPDAGGYWEQRCDTILRGKGFQPVDLRVVFVGGEQALRDQVILPNS